MLSNVISRRARISASSGRGERREPQISPHPAVPATNNRSFFSGAEPGLAALSPPGHLAHINVPVLQKLLKIEKFRLRREGLPRYI
jgi:hypothetical protein